VHAALTRKASPGWEQVRWLTGCGTKDVVRYQSAVRFYESLSNGSAEFIDWPLEHEVDASVLERVALFFNGRESELGLAD
jgi:hypothetical protein